jgi:hypothetical protein
MICVYDAFWFGLAFDFAFPPHVLIWCSEMAHEERLVFVDELLTNLVYIYALVHQTNRHRYFTFSSSLPIVLEVHTGGVCQIKPNTAVVPLKPISSLPTIVKRLVLLVDNGLRYGCDEIEIETCNILNPLLVSLPPTLRVCRTFDFLQRQVPRYDNQHEYRGKFAAISSHAIGLPIDSWVHHQLFNLDVYLDLSVAHTLH